LKDWLPPADYFKNSLYIVSSCVTVIFILLLQSLLLVSGVYLFENTVGKSLIQWVKVC